MRTIGENDCSAIIKNKKQYPFELVYDLKIKISTTERNFSFIIRRGYCWNGADIPPALFIFGQSKDNSYLIASMVHDYMLEYKGMIYNTVLNREVNGGQYRRLTSLIFGEILKKQKTSNLKASCMVFIIDFFQKYFQFYKWKNLG